MSRPRLDNPRRAVTVKLPPALIERWEREAKRSRVTKTAVLQRALEAMLPDETPRPSPAGREAKTETASEGQRDRPAVTRQGASRPVASPRDLAVARTEAFRRATGAKP